MSVLAIKEQGSVVGINDGRIEVRFKRDILLTCPIHLVESLVIYGSVQITTQLLRISMEYGITVFILSANGTYLGDVIPHERQGVEVIRNQFYSIFNEESKLYIANQLVIYKIEKIIEALLKYRNNHKEVISKNSIKQCQTELKKLGNHDYLNYKQLMGIEGIVSRIYFKEYYKLLNRHLTIQVKNRREDLLVNQLQNYVYALLASEIKTKLVIAGFHPKMGFLHSELSGRDSLVYDVMEPFRISIADKLILHLISRKIIVEDHLKNGRITDEGIDIVLQQWFQWLEKYRETEVYEVEKNIIWLKEIISKDDIS